MKKNSLYLAWGALYIVCTGFGFIREPVGFVKAMLVLLSAGFFVPPALLLAEGVKHGSREKLKLIRNLSALSLGLTLVLLVGNFLSVLLPQAVGKVLYWLLVFVSTPMVCSQYWAVSMFLWAALLFTAMEKLKKI